MDWIRGEIAQLAEQAAHIRSVVGSTPSLAIMQENGGMGRRFFVFAPGGAHKQKSPAGAGLRSLPTRQYSSQHEHRTKAAQLRPRSMR